MLNERQTGQFSHYLTIYAGLEAEVELLQGFYPWEARLFQTAFHAALMSAVLFFLFFYPITEQDGLRG